ncbi:hypothetical protein ABPG74_020902 [Tetrahymena malaccensis]
MTNRFCGEDQSNLFSLIYITLFLEQQSNQIFMENHPFKLDKLFNAVSVEELTSLFNEYQNELHNQLIIDLSVSYSNKNQCEVISNLGLSNQNLNKVSLSFLHCPIEDSGISSLCLKISQLQNIKDLNLNFSLTFCTESSAVQISLMLKQLSKLQNLRINLYGNNIGPQGYKELIKSISSLSNLNNLTLGLRKTELEAQYLENTGILLSKLTKLKFLKLNFKDSQLKNGLAHLFTGFLQFDNLEEFRLNLEMSSISSQDFQVLAQNIQRNQVIKYLSLNLKNNLIQRDIMNNLINNIADKKQLFYFKFKTLYMQLQDDEIKNIQKIIQTKMAKIKVLIDDLNLGLRISNQDRKKWQQLKLKMKYLVCY